MLNGANCSPAHYDLTIRTDLRDLTFSGTVEIAIHVAKTVEHLTLHAADPLQLEAAVLAPAGAQDSSSRAAEKIVVDEKKQRAQVSFANGSIKAGDYKIGLRWTGKIKRTPLRFTQPSSRDQDRL